MWNGLKTTNIATQNTKDLLKNSDKRITETSSKVKALEKEIDNERSKEMGKIIKNLHEGLKKQQEKVDSIVQSTTLIKNQRKNMNKKQTMTENSIKQFSNEIKKLQTELKAEQQKNIILENKLITFECQLKEIFLRIDIKQNPNKETCIKGAPTINTSPQRCDFVTETCRLTNTDPQTKNNVPGQLGAQSEFLITDNSKWIVVAPKDPDDVSISEEAKRKYLCVGINQSANKEQESMCSLLPKEEAFYEQESSASPVHSQTNELNEKECLDLAYDCNSEEDGTFSYLEKVYAYLQDFCKCQECLHFQTKKTWNISSIVNEVIRGICMSEKNKKHKNFKQVTFA